MIFIGVHQIELTYPIENILLHLSEYSWLELIESVTKSCSYTGKVNVRAVVHGYLKDTTNCWY